ncbi:protein of unknown function [Candidatus Filomicrobium marinum]|uniref:Uncharacterized protein n=1 Tax=Candidatus Filomicrobium marinum TaxID=1608628 RepID=A0A0D6JCT0_9HYPH|nr:protein of unknown function [Candidatus Filomicrobium marinum]
MDCDPLTERGLAGYVPSCLSIYFMELRGEVNISARTTISRNSAIRSELIEARGARIKNMRSPF